MKIVAGISAIIATCVGACATASTGIVDHNSIRAQIPIGNFDGYDPYPPGAPGIINAYVNFAADGILRASLGCEKFGAPFTIDEDNTLILLNETGLSKPDYSISDCSPDLIQREQSLARFLESRPRIYPWSVEGTYLKKRKKSLLLQSVAQVLDDDVKQKVEL